VKAVGTKTDWTSFDAMTEEQRHAAALADPDAQPLTDEDMQRMKRTPQVKIIRRALQLSQEEIRGALSHSRWNTSRLGAGPQ
jgi:hypothetical protein